MVCKKYYSDVVILELNIDNNNYRPLLIWWLKSVEDIVVEHNDEMAKWNIKVPVEMKELPVL